MCTFALLADVKVLMLRVCGTDVGVTLCVPALLRRSSASGDGKLWGKLQLIPKSERVRASGAHGSL